ncbi:MAG: ribonuclease Y [Nitrospinota bacterium]
MDASMISGYAITGAVAIAVGFFISRFLESRKLSRAEDNARAINDEARKEAENIRRDALLESKDVVLKARNEFEREMRESRKEQMNVEKRIQQRTSNLDRKMDQLEQKEREFQNREKELKRQMEKTKDAETRYEALIVEELKKLEEVSSMSVEHAKEELKVRLFEETRSENANIMKRIEDDCLAEANKNAQKIIGLAIQRCSADAVAESTVSIVNLASDEMKGRIIGREGRNIKALETATGVDLIIDDTPEAVILSCYDPIKREVARVALERLVIDGRIHPARIEDVVNKVRKELDRSLVEEGKKAAMEVRCEGLHPELIKLLGRLKYRTSYSQNVLMHSKEVAFLCGMMASELGLDVRMAKRAGLLHDIGKAASHEVEGSHAQIGADIVRRHNEKPLIVNAVESHHEDVEAESVIATLISAADTLSASRPGVRTEMLEAYVKRLRKLEEIGNSFKGVEKTFAIQAGREIRVSVVPESVNDSAAYLLAKDIAKKIESEMAYPGEIKVTVIRETRVTEFAR